MLRSFREICEVRTVDNRSEEMVNNSNYLNIKPEKKHADNEIFDFWMNEFKKAAEESNVN